MNYEQKINELETAVKFANYARCDYRRWLNNFYIKSRKLTSSPMPKGFEKFTKKMVGEFLKRDVCTPELLRCYDLAKKTFCEEDLKKLRETGYFNLQLGKRKIYDDNTNTEWQLDEIFLLTEENYLKILKEEKNAWAALTKDELEEYKKTWLGEQA